MIENFKYPLITFISPHIVGSLILQRITWSFLDRKWWPGMIGWVRRRWWSDGQEERSLYRRDNWVWDY